MRFLRIVLIAACPAFGQSSTPQMPAAAAARFLDQATWGPTPASIAQLQQMGISNWLNAQFALNTSNIPDQPLLDSSGQTKPRHSSRAGGVFSERRYGTRINCGSGWPSR